MAGAPDALSKLIPTASKSCSPGNETGTSNHSPSGMTSPPLTGDPGETASTSSPADSPAKTSVAPARGQASKASAADSGWRWRESFVRFDPATSSWRTRQCLLLGGSESFSATWPRWGLMRDGECSEQTTPGAFTEGDESGFWPTPTVMMTPCSSKKAHAGVHLLGAAILDVHGFWPIAATRGAAKLHKHPDWIKGQQLSPPWVEWLMGWPIGWTDCEPLATDKFQQWLDSHGKR